MDDNDPLIYGGRGGGGGLLSRLKLSHICWAITFVLLVVLVSLLSYQVHLTRRIAATTKTIDNNNNPNNQYSEYTQSITSAMDFSADPCKDFYQYSCGSLIANTQLPPGVNMYIPIFNDVQLGNYLTLNNIVNDQWPLINDLYTSCMVDSNTLQQDTVQALTGVVTMIQAMNATTAPVFLSTLATLHRMGVNAFFSPTPQENIFQPNSLMNLMFSEDTLSLNLSIPSTVNRLASVIQSTVGSIFPTFTGANASNAAQVEATLFQYLYEDVPENITDIYVNMTWSDFATLTGADYSPYTNQIGLDMNSTSTVIVVTPDYMKGLSSFFGSNLQAVQDYLVWRVIYSFTFSFPILPEDDSLLDTETVETKAEMRRALNAKPSFVNAEMLRPHLSYATQFTSQQISCIDAVDTLLGDFVGLIFSMQTIDADVINDIHTVTGGIQNSFKNNLAGLSWIDASSKANADFKLSNILQIIGHPNKLDRYRGLFLDNENFLENIIAINQRVFDYEMTNINTPYNRSDSEFPATIVNAFYNPEANTINFPAGILESPMFSTSFPALMQYARMGYVIGHETTHGFDNNGRLWNAYGVYQPIMDDASSEEFNQRAQCIVDQYNQFQPVPGIYVNGEQTLGENIADIGGVKNAFLAYQAWVKANGTASLQLKEKSFVPQLTNEQAFFVVLGQTWCTKATQQGLAQQVQTDVHSPSQYRVNGPLANLQEFADAFNCPKNSPMNPTNKCELW